MTLKLKGVIVPIVTPMDAAGGFDAAAVRPLVDYLVAAGAAGLYPGGTTGEGFLLTIPERRALAEAVVAAAAGRVPVIVQTGCITTAETIELTEHARATGADAAAVIPPYVYRHSDAALLDHYAAVAGRVPDLPLLLYNFPAISNNTLTTSLVLKLREICPNVVGMKDSSGSLEMLAQLKVATDGAFLAFNGGDGQVLAGAAMGLDGCVSGNGNVVPELMAALYRAAAAHDLDQARGLQQQVNQVRELLGDGGDLSLFKQMLAKRGIPVGDVRPPLRKASAEIVEDRWRRLAALGVLPTAAGVSGVIRA
jgi:dihydrodipicolinate synthase/N-acetylneuraminate lyase